jgi:hypothetical protein
MGLYIYCPYSKFIPNIILKKLNLIVCGVFLLNLNKNYRITDSFISNDWVLEFTDYDCFGKFYFSKKLYNVRKVLQ